MGNYGSLIKGFNMSGIKISALPSITNPIGSDVLPIVQSGVTYKTTIDQLIDAVITPGNIRLATAVALTATYNNGSSGVGATLVNAGALAALSLDGTVVAVNDRVLIKDQASTFQNGIYSVTVVGDGATAWVLTRTTDYDTSSEIDAGDFFTVYAGTVNARTQWIQTQVITTVGTDAILFQSNVVAGTNVTKTNNTISVAENLFTYKFIQSQTAANSTSIDFINLSSTYSTYVVFLYNVIPIVDGDALWMRTSTDNGATYDSGAADYSYSETNVTDAGGTSVIASAGAAQIILNGNIGNAANEQLSGCVQILNPSAVAYTKILIQTNDTSSAGVFRNVNGGGQRLSAGDVDAIRFLCSTGNISSGTFKLYGIKAA